MREFSYIELLEYQINHIKNVKNAVKNVKMTSEMLRNSSRKNLIEYQDDLIDDLDTIFNLHIDKWGAARKYYLLREKMKGAK